MAEDLEEAASPYVGLSDDIKKAPGVRCNRIYRNSILCAFLIVVALCGKAIFRKPNNGERAEGAVVEYVISRGRIEGVSEKSVGVSFWTYPWTIAELSWQRTGFHFQTEANWMNDPNGPLVYKGWYHLFYQYNPVATVWGNIAWGHIVSKDLVHWFYLDLAMIPDHWYDINGIWTGSATFLANETLVMLYTGSTNESVQVQNLAFPEDSSNPLLRKWVKSEANPILVPPKGVGPKDFRDPTTGWIGKDRIWRIAIRSKLGMTGVTLVYSKI